MNHFNYYFTRINSKETNKQILEIVSKSSCIKFFGFCEKIRKLNKKCFKSRSYLKRIFLESIEEFSNYCCYLMNDKNKILFNFFFKTILKEFSNFFLKEKANYNRLYNQLKKGKSSEKQKDIFLV